MKIDLDDLERKAKRWDKAIGKDDEADARLDHIAANSPPVTLALIARIRELEAAYGQIVDDHVRNESDADAIAMQALLDKGAVLA